MAKSAPPTAKGARQAEAIIEAAIGCLGRDGYAAASLQKIADEAGVSKRAVLYYFDGREDLLEQVVRRIGERLLERVGAAVAGLEEPSEMVAAGFAIMWEAFAKDRALLAAYFGLVAESVTDPALRRSTTVITDGIRTLVGRAIAEGQTRGRRPVLPPEVLIEVVVGGMQGLTLTYLERGETPELMGTIAEFNAWLGSALPQRG